MWATIFASITSFFRAFIIIGSSVEHLAKAGEFISKIAEESAGQMYDESASNRAKAAKLLESNA